MTELKIFLDKEDYYGKQRTHEYIMRYLLRHNIRGAIIFEGLMGFGHKHHLNLPKQIGTTDDEPLMILVIDEDDNIKTVMPHLEEVVEKGMIVVSRVEKIV